MCIAALGPILSFAGSIVGAMGQIQAANAQAAQAEFQQKQSNLIAEDTLRRGAQEEEGSRRETAALKGRQEAVMAAGNIDLGSGSPLKILGDTAALGELDAQVIRSNAARDATVQKQQGQLYGMQAKSARQAGMIGAFGTILGGAGTLAEKWYKPVALA